REHLSHEDPMENVAHPNPHLPVKPQQVEVTVNGRAVKLPKEELTGLDIKQAAIAQHVPIELSFILELELPNGRSPIIGDHEFLNVRNHERFTAIANDDNS